MTTIDGCAPPSDEGGSAGARREFLGAIAAVFAAGFVPAALVAGQASAQAVKRIDLDIKGGALPRDRRTVRVKQGDQVELHFTSDRTLRLHLHGYDIQRTVEPGTPAVMAFHARIAGRFSIASVREGQAKRGGHHHGGTVLYLEVHP